MVEYMGYIFQENDMNKEEVRIKIVSELYEVEESLFSTLPEDDGGLEEAIAEAAAPEEESDVLKINTCGTLTVDGGRITYSYDETEST